MNNAGGRGVGWLGLLAFAAIGCSFQKAGVQNQMNSCVLDSDCASKHCEAGLCVMTGAQPLNVILEVTPKRMPDGSQPFPIVGAPFALESGNKASFSLSLPIPVSVNVHDNDTRFDSQVTFQPSSDSNFIASSTQVTVSTSVGAAATNASVLLLDGLDYDVFVKPVDSHQPPHATTLHVSAGAALDIDYSTVKWRDRKFIVHNPPPGALTLRARAADGGMLVSNSVPLGPDGSGTLRFDEGNAPYQVEVAGTEMVRAASDAAPCAQTSPLIPTLDVDASALVADKSDASALAVQLPDLPAAVNYSGSVSICADQLPSKPNLTSLPMSFKTTVISFGSDSQTVDASFETASQATWDDDSKSFTFCTRILPGDYVVVVTPPANINCEIFSERRLLTPDPGMDIQDVALTLRTPATLSGTIVTPDQTPMANATVDLIALGLADVTLAVNDPTVPLYNRSRQSISAANGSFKVQPDVGSYDVVVKPPSQSNFAWRVIYDVDVASRTATFATVVNLSAPVAVSGALQYVDGSKSDQSTLAAAEVHAFTVVNEGQPTARSIEIARTQADANGNITLLMSPDLQKNWIPQ